MIPMEWGGLATLQAKCMEVGGDLLSVYVGVEYGRFQVDVYVTFAFGISCGRGIGAKYDTALREAVECAINRRDNILSVET